MMSNTEPAASGKQTTRGLGPREVTGIFCSKCCRTTWLLKLQAMIILTLKNLNLKSPQHSA